MENFITDIFNGDLPVLLGDLYTPCLAAAVTSCAIIAFASVCQMFTLSLTAIFNSRGAK